ncbi:prophage tail fiber N-terminal domain-containing protein [Pectobacterium odoriferum]|uniref:phage tail fiber protein n=1 Tax=Pectobacterium odoriferum TaxID=78398 RepID=UPI0032ED59AE
MSVLISGVLMNPAGVPVSGAEVTFSALTNGPSVLNGFSASVMTDQDGNYAIPLEICEYAISIQSDGYNSVYGSVSINEKSTPTTINALLKLAAMEQTVTPAIIVYFREIQTDVAAKLAAIQTLNNSAAAASHDATAAKNEAAQYAQNLSAAVTQAQQARTSATASASTATAAKNAAETAAGNAQATLSDTMKKSANGSDIVSAEAFRANIGLEVQTSSTDATSNRILKLSASGEGAFGLGGNAIAIPTGSTIPTYFNNLPTGFYRAGSNIAGTFSPICDYQWIRHDANNGVLIAVGIGAIGAMAFRLLSAGGWSGWRAVWHDGNITLAGMYADRGPIGTADLDTLFGPDYRGTWTQGSTANATTERHYPVLSAGSLEVIYNAVTGVGTVQKYTTHVTNKVFIRRKATSGESWSNWEEFWTTANLANPLTLDTVQTIANVKFFKSGQMPLRLLAQTTGDALFIPFYDADGTTRKGWIGRGSVNVNTIQLNNDATGTSLSLLGNGDINLVTQGNGSLNWNGQQLITAGSTQTIGGAKTFTSNLNVARSSFPGLELTNTGIAAGVVGRYRFITAADANSVNIYSRTASDVTTGQTVVSIPTRTNGNVLVSGNNAVADSSGFWKTASPVINIYADGSFTATYEAEGVDVERLSEGVYKITGCHGMHSDAAWNGIDGGVSNPKCRNGLELTWNDFSVESDGSVIVRTYHRPHPDAISFARNEIDGYENSDPIDVPPGLFIQVRVNMPAQTEGKSSVSHSNVYCNSVSPT